MRSWFLLLSILQGMCAAPARAEYYEFCHSTYCHPYYWLWYPRTPPGLGYGKNVKLNPGGEWINRDGQRVWSKQGTRYATVLSQHNPDQRNGELAYRTAYASFIDGRSDGSNKVERISEGRWIKKITTGDGIVLFKDAYGNLAVQSPDGKWHVTNGRGDYAQTSLDLQQTEIVARSDVGAVAPTGQVAKKPKPEVKVVAVKAKKPKNVAAGKKKKSAGRSLASIPSKAPAAPAGAIKAPETAAKAEEPKLEDIKDLLQAQAVEKPPVKLAEKAPAVAPAPPKKDAP